MASSMRVGMVLARSACNHVQTTLFKQCTINQRTLPQVILSRGRRRTCFPRPYNVKRKSAEAFTIGTELTAENKTFIKELVQEKFQVRKSPLKEEPWERHEWTVHPHTRRAGVLAIKLGVIPQWTKTGQKSLISVLQVIDNHVISYTPPEKFAQSLGCKHNWRNKYGQLVVGALSCSPHMFTSGYNQLFTEAGVPPKRKLTRFVISPNAAIQPGTPLYATHFKVGDYVDCQAKTIGHGFQGVVKRWGFKGGPASHGATKFHRKPGSTGAGRKKKGRWKGKKMPGHMGMDWSTLRGLQIWRINTKYNLLYIKGYNIPGPNHCYVRIMDSTLNHRYRQRAQDPPSMPTFYPDEQDEPLPEELFMEDIHQFTDPTVTYEEDGKTG